MPSESRRFYGLQILRGFAAVLVLFHHQLLVSQDHIPGTPMAVWLDNGAFGVDIFFPLSGFVMYLTAAGLSRRQGDGLSLSAEFLRRRIVRIVPVYWGLTTLKLILFFLLPAMMLHFTWRPWNVVGSYLFIPAFDHNAQAEPVLPVGWTLNAEMMFYAIVAAALALRAPLLRLVPAVIVALSVAGFIVGSPATHSWQALLYWTNPVALEFVAGMALAAMMDRFRKVPSWLAFAIAAGALAFALLCPVGDAFTFSRWRPLIWGVPGVLIVWAMLCLEGRFRFKEHRFLLLLGDASFSLYLLQTFLVPGFGFLAGRVHLQGVEGTILFFLLSTPLVVGLSVLFHVYLELPLLKSLSRRRLPFSTGSADTATA